MDGVTEKLHSDLKRGLTGDADDIAARKLRYGINTLPHTEQTSFWTLLWEALQDRTLIILVIASLISIGIGVYEQVEMNHKAEEAERAGLGPQPAELGSWVEGVAIMVAVFLVALVNSGNDYQKEKQFRKLNAKKEDREIRSVRNGIEMQLSIFEIVVGDILHVETGEVVPADGLFISGHNVKCDESGMTGESDAIRKGENADPFMLSGTRVLDGVGTMLVINVGPHSLNGKTMLALRTENEDTPLQVKLGNLAESIGKLGLSAAILMLIILIIRYVAENSINSSFPTDGAVIASDIVGFFITAITIVVVAVPEGLPMAVTLALAYATIQMIKDQNLVRVLAACETMGGATTICSDKTGTLTQNKMTVVRGTVCDAAFGNIEESKNIGKAVGALPLELLTQGICLNSSAYEATDEHGKTTFVGSKTESALLGLSASVGVAYGPLRERIPPVMMYPFSSEKKRMSVLIKADDGNYRLYVKGASEIVLGYCDKFMGPTGQVSPLDATKTEEINNRILSYASSALRTISLAYREFTPAEYESLNWEEPPEDSLTLVALLGIQDPLRPEVPDAVRACQTAGIKVRMVTGDNIVTARSIAQECGILTPRGIVMEGSEFRRLAVDQMDRLVPNLDVLARSSPTDKQLLVGRLKDLGETVAVTGDGTNDGPALKLADVGFAMGIAGTEVAKEASDIILMDDNFASIVKAVIWGRCVYDAVRKFLQFQLTVNIVAVALAFISAVSDSQGQSVLSAVQLLWINLIMDTLAALALATEPPSDAVLQRRPHSKADPLISFEMWKLIIGNSVLQVIVCLVLLYAGPSLFHLDTNIPLERTISRTIVFNSFTFMQLFNQINCRVLGDTLNPFRRIHKHKSFVIIILIEVLGQVIIVQWGGAAFKTASLDGYQWLTCILIGFLSLPLGTLHSPWMQPFS